MRAPATHKIYVRCHSLSRGDLFFFAACVAEQVGIYDDLSNIIFLGFRHSARRLAGLWVFFSNPALRDGDGPGKGGGTVNPVLRSRFACIRLPR